MIIFNVIHTFAISFFKISFLMMSLVAFLVLEKEKALLFDGEWDCKKDFHQHRQFIVWYSITISISISIPPTLEGDVDLGEREDEVLSSDFLFIKIDLWRTINDQKIM